MRLVLAFCATLALAAQPPADMAISAVLDDWHRAAAQADEARYFGHLAEGAVFLGTDGTERWTKAAFQAWAHPIFQRGSAWRFKATRRAITLSEEGTLAWFDEDLATENMGPCRGSGVLARVGGRWLIRQYDLSVPIPNGLLKSVTGQIEALSKKP